MMHPILGAFGGADKETAVCYIAAVVCFLLAGLSGAGRWRGGGSILLIGIGLALWLFPTMWNTADAAF